MFVELLHDHLGQKSGTRIDVSDADGSFLISAGRAKAVAGDPLSDAVGRSISDAMTKITGGLEKAVDVALARFAQAQTKSRRNSLPEIFGAGGEGDPKRTFGAFLIAVKSQDRKALDEMGSQFVEWGSVEKKAALSTQGGAAGGFTVMPLPDSDVTWRAGIGSGTASPTQQGRGRTTSNSHPLKGNAPDTAVGTRPLP